MTGSMIIGALLLADAALLAEVPAERIKAGKLPDGISLPCILVRTISSVEWQTLRRGNRVRTTDRIEVTVRAESYRDQVDVLQLVRNACAGRTGDIGGGQSVSILSAGGGPDLMGPGNAFEQSHDFRVSYDA